MKLKLKSATQLPLLAAIGLLSACSSVKELSNVKVWPFSSSAEKPRVYQPANSTPYLCEGNKKFFVRMLDNGASAWLILPDREVLLPQAGTSKTFTNGISKLDLSSDDVSLDVNETTKYVACKANGLAAQSAEVATQPETKQVSEKGWLSKLKFWESDEPTKAPEVVASMPAKVAEAAVVVAPVVAEQAVATPQPENKVVETETVKPTENASAASGAESQAAISEVAGQAKPAEEASMARDDQSSNMQAQVVQSLDAWAKAWRSKNADGYLSAYSAKFKPEGISKKTWLKQRKQRVGANPGEIALTLEKVNVVADAKKAEARFIQHYASGKFSDTVAKVLNFENDKGHWLIVKETSKASK